MLKIIEFSQFYIMILVKSRIFSGRNVIFMFWLHRPLFTRKHFNLITIVNIIGNKKKQNFQDNIY